MSATPSAPPVHAEARMQRSADFARALSDMRRAAIAIDDPARLYDATCRILVESGHATMAWIGLIEGTRLQPVAWGGAAQAYTDGLDIQITGPGAVQGPSARAAGQGCNVICNEFMTDPITVPWRERAARFGVKASGAFPMRRGGRTVGTVNLYFPDIGAFDAGMVELVELLVCDLAFALEHIDREAARAQAVREARAGEQALVQRELQLSGIVETALEAIISIDASHRVVLFNPAAEQMFGVSREEAIGGSIDRFLPGQYRHAHGAHLTRFATEGRSSRSMGGTRELMGVRANGEVFPIEASISRAGQGEQQRMTVMARDVTQLRQAERAQLARTAAEAASQAKTEFLSRISHELRTPLNAVLGFAQLMRADTRDPLSDAHRAQLDLVLQAGSHLSALIEEMLDVARIETGRMALEERDFDLCELIASAVALCEPQAMQCRVSLHASCAAAAPLRMHTDPARLRQVMLNLLSNAIKYNRPGGWVKVQVERQPGAVHITVQDNGLGMTEAQKSRLFQPFNRLGREFSDVQGTGIGLVLVRQLVSLMHGELTVESRADEGTRVRVSLPLGDEWASAAAAPAREAAGARPAMHKGLVLYIEDNPVNAVLVEQLLSRWPQVRTVVAGDGQSGIERARTLQPDLVLLDLQLPDMDGMAVLRALKDDPVTQALPVVVLSASAGAVDMQAARQAGALHYWTKPIDFDRFIEGMGELLPQAVAA